jgi:hypothetical protein
VTAPSVAAGLDSYLPSACLHCPFSDHYTSIVSARFVSNPRHSICCFAIIITSSHAASVHNGPFLCVRVPGLVCAFWTLSLLCCHRVRCLSNTILPCVILQRMPIMPQWHCCLPNLIVSMVQAPMSDQGHIKMCTD